MRKFVNSVLIIVFLFSIIPPDVFLAQDQPILRSGIRNFGFLFNQLWNFEEFNQEVPMTNTTPAEVLHLNEFFSTVFTEIPIQVSMPPTSFSKSNGVEGEISVTLKSQGEQKIATITLHAEKIEPLPISYIYLPEELSNPSESGTCEDFVDNDEDDLKDGEDPDCTMINISGGEVDTKFFLDTVLTFIEEEDGEVYLSGNDPTINVSYTANESVIFKSKFNIANVDITGDVIYNGQIEAKIIDENQDGKISTQDWQNTILVDLIQMDYVNDADSDVNIDLSISLDNTVFDTGAGVGSLSLTIPNLNEVDVLNPDLDPGGLKDFLSVNPDELLTGLGSYSVALDTMWLTGEGELPFIQERLHNLTGLQEQINDQFLPGESIRSLVKKQGDAFVYCGTQQTIPLEGDPNIGGILYCQAFTPYEPTVISWELGSISAEYLDDIADTVGINPTGWAKFTNVAEGDWKNIQVTYEYEEVTHVVEPRIQSIGDLKEKLLEIPVIDNVAVGYNSLDSTLVFDLQQVISQDNPAETKIHLMFGDQLQKHTNIANIHSEEQTLPTMDLGNVSIHAGFGTILVDDVRDITPDPKWEDGDSASCSDGMDNDDDGWVDIYDSDCPKLEDRFFVAVNPTGNPEIMVDTLLISDLLGYQLEGVVGSVQVDIEVTNFSITANPALELSIIPTTIGVDNSATISNVVGVRNLISKPELGKNISRAQDLDLEIEINVFSSLLGVTDSITINWIDFPAGSPIISGGNSIKSLDIAPSVIGTHDGAENKTDLVDSTADFIEDFDVEVGDFVSKTIYNLTNGSVCTGFTVLRSTSLQCSSPLSGSENDLDIGWNTGDEYIIEGDSRALLTLVEDSLYSLASQFYNNDKTGKSLPLIGMNMQELVPQLSETMDAISKIRFGDPSTEIFCEITDDQEKISCWAVSDLTPEVIDKVNVEWSINNGTCEKNCEEANTIYLSAPTNLATKAEFNISDLDPSQNLKNLSVTLKLMYKDNTTDIITYPHQRPETLQEFEKALEEETGVDLNINLVGNNLELRYIDPGSTTIQSFPLSITLNSSFGETPLIQKDGDQRGDELHTEITPSINFFLQVPLNKYAALEDVQIQTGTQTSVDVNVDESNFSIGASIGGMQVELGTGAEISLSVSSTPNFYDAIDDQITQTYTIINSGTRDLEAPFIVYDSYDVEICRIKYETLEAGNSLDFVSCDKTFYVSELPEYAYAEVKHEGSQLQSRRETIRIPQRLQLKVTADSLFYDSQNGSDINLSFTITNYGDSELSDLKLDLQLLDMLPTNDNGIPVLCDFDPAGNISKGDSATCDTTITITQETVVEVKVTAKKPDDSNVESQVVELAITSTEDPELLLEAETFPGSYGAIGDLIYYEFTITNAGNVPLNSPFTVLEITKDQDNKVCELNDTSVLSPGESVACTYEYTITEEDLSLETLEKTFRSEASDPAQLSEEVKVPVSIASSSIISANFSKTLSITEEQSIKAMGQNNGFALEDLLNIAILNIQLNLRNTEGELIGRLNSTDSLSIAITEKMEQTFALEPVDISLITIAFPMLRDIIEQNLDADRWSDLRIPLAGSDLSAGIDFNEIINGTEGLSSPFMELFDDWDNGTNTIQELCPSNENYTIFIITADVRIDLCNLGNYSLDDIAGLEIEFSETSLPETENIAFDIGLPGVPLESIDESPISTEVDKFSLNVTIGIDRFSGPYVIFGGEGENPLLTIDANIQIDPSTQVNCNTGIDFPGELEMYQDKDYPCMSGVIGLLGGRLFDVNDGGSVVELHLQSGVEKQLLTFADFMEGSGILGAPRLNNSNGNIELLFRTTTPVLPTIIGTISLDYNGGVFKSLSYENVYMNVDLVGFMGSAVSEVQKYTKPLQPVVDTLTAPLPVISDLSTMVGQDSISLLSIMKAVPSNKLTMVTRLSEMIAFVNNIPASSTGVWIGLAGDAEQNDEAPGSFTVDIEKVNEPLCAEEDTKSEKVTSKTCVSDGKVEKIKEWDLGKNKDSNSELKASVGASWEGAGITMPILSDTSQVYGMLMGVDATLIRIDLGTLSASAGLEYSYGPFLVGPVPVSISIGGSVTLEGRFAIGFDTRGLRSTLRGEAFSDNVLLDGIFIDDLDLNGNDVPEIKLEVSVYAGASVSVKVIEAGIRAGVTFGVELNWNDPNDDGKLRIDEIGIWAAKPICLFDRRGYIGFYLEFYLKFDFFLFSTTLSWRPVDETYELFNESCEPPKPILAEVDGDEQQLILYIGDNYANDRGVYNTTDNDKNEKVMVRQLSERGQGCKIGQYEDGPATRCSEPNGTWVSVTFQGIHQYFFLDGDGDNKNYSIFAEAGKGNDQISLLPGTATIEKEGVKTTIEILFTIDAHIDGGKGDDRIDTGNGTDKIYGGPGNDNLNGRGGEDIIWGEAGNDSLNGGQGNDELYGGDDDDIINGGPGMDYIFGESGNDSLFGGPGLSSEFEIDLRDVTDYIIGGPGMDTLEGGFGDDCLFGDEVNSELPQVCASILEKPGNNINENEGTTENQQTENGYDDHLIGGEDNDYLYGGPGNDSLEGGNGEDKLYGQAGHDILMGGRHSDDLFGDSGHDWLQGDQGNDRLKGGSDDDDLIGGDGQDHLFGEGGNDILLGDLGTISNHVLENGTPIDHRLNVNQDSLKMIGTIYGDHDREEIEGEENKRTLIDTDIDFLDSFGVEPNAYISKVIYNMSDGSSCSNFRVSNENTITCLSDLSGGENNYWEKGDLYAIEGDTLANVQPMTASTGDPNILPNEYNDYLVGGVGEDFLFGEAGADMIYGDDGNDYLEGNAGDDRMDGNGGSDNMLGGKGNDVMYGGGGWSYNQVIQDDQTEANHDIGDLSDKMWGNSGNDIIYGNLGNDEINGNLGSDYIEGNAGDDTIHGGPGDDDIIGGSNEAGEVDTGDHLFGDEGSDTILGDNGFIDYAVEPIVLIYELEKDTFGDLSFRHAVSGISSSRNNRIPVMIDNANASWDIAGADWIEGGPGDDQIFGQFGVDFETGLGDILFGQQGQDLIVGDQGTAECWVNTSVDQQVLETNAPFLIDEIYVENTLHCTTNLTSTDRDGDDRISGGENADWLFGGGGSDLLNGDAGNDRIFGGSGDDHLWGGPHHDHLWGGLGEDFLDVLPREGYSQKQRGKVIVFEADPQEYFDWAGQGAYTGIDYIYGGMGQDSMQADVTDTGKNPGDRMIDWIGVFNIYYLCTAQYGEGVITRSPSPQVINFLVELARSDGAYHPDLDFSSGYWEVAIVYQEYYKVNSHPPHPDTPGHFTCEP